MRRILSGFLFLLASGAAFAQKAIDEGGGGPPSETVDVIWVVLFAVIFVGMIGYFFWYLWRNEQKQKLEGKEPEQAG